MSKMFNKESMNLAKRIKSGLKDAEDYKTGLVGEQMIVSAYNTMPLEKLEKLRFILNKIIKKKKDAIRITQQNETAVLTDTNSNLGN